MKYLRILLIFSLTIACQNNNVNENKDNYQNPDISTALLNNRNYIISGNSADLVILGEVLPTNSIYKYEQVKTNAYEEQEVYYRVFEKDKTLMSVWLDSLKLVKKIKIYSPKLKTKEGIGIGSKLSEFYKIYEDAQVVFSNNTLKFITSTEKYKNVHFLLNNESYDGIKTAKKNEIVKLKYDSFKENAKIEVIVISLNY